MRIECGGLTFISDFDSGNLDKVEFVSEFNKNYVTERSSGSSSSSPSYLNSVHITKSTSKSIPNKYENKKNTKNGPCKSSSGPVPKMGPSSKSTLSTPMKTCHQSLTFKKNLKFLEFRVWTKPDCKGTPFENPFRSWFHFGIEGGFPGCVIKIHVMNLNRQGKLYFYGMRPVYRIVPGKDSWKRIPGKVHYRSENDGNFVIDFSHSLPSQAGSVIYFAFTYPFSYSACQEMLDDIDRKVGSSLYLCETDLPPENSIYYCRELLCYSLDGRRVELLTVTSLKGFTKEREARLPHLFPDHSKPRCHVFCDKKVIFLSSRVHPGETPSSFVFNGILRTLLCPKDPKAIKLRHLYVFKLIPLLNPDGVWRGHFRTDSRGVNLNRTYLIATPELHPSVYASRSLLLHYHVIYSSPHDALKENCRNTCQNRFVDSKRFDSLSQRNIHRPIISDVVKASSEIKLVSPACSTLSVGHYIEGETLTNVSDSATGGEAFLDRSLSVSDLCLKSSEKRANNTVLESNSLYYSESLHSGSTSKSPKLTFSPSFDSQLSADMKPFRSCSDLEASDIDEETPPSPVLEKATVNPSNIVSNINPETSGIAYYIDLHGHACKRGCFIYGNYFSDLEQKVECMLLAKLMSINSPYFDFGACNFTAENMRSGGKRTGETKEGCGRVALHKFTGIIHSYTLECNYNTGRSAMSSLNRESTPEKSVEFFSPEVYEQVGEALLVSILDATGSNPHCCIPHHPLGSLQGVRDWLRKYALSVQSRNKNDFLKKNMLNARLTKTRDKCIHSSPALSAKFVKGLQHNDQDCRISHLAANVKRNIMSPPLSNEKFLAEFGIKYKRLHASSPSLDHFRSSNKCLDSLKNLTPKVKSLASVKTTSVKTVSNKTPPKKGKGSRMAVDKGGLYHIQKESSELLMENQKKAKNSTTLTKGKVTDKVFDDLKGKKFSTSSVQTSRKASKPKKKSGLPSFQTSEQPVSAMLLKNEGNLRQKKLAKKIQKS